MQSFVSLSPKKQLSKAKIWIILSIAALLLGNLAVLLSSLYHEMLFRQMQRDTAYELAANASALTAAIESKLQYTNGLRAFVSNELAHAGGVSAERFDTFSAAFIDQTPGIRNLSIYPEGIAQFVYPYEGNISLFGLDLFNHPDPEVRNNAERTRHGSDMTVIGPRELTQQGIGLISRQSVFMNGEFWGFVSVVLDVDPILHEADLIHDDKGIDLAVRANSLVLIGDPGLFAETSTTRTIKLRDIEWDMAAVPSSSKQAAVASNVRIFIACCVAALLLFIYFLYSQLTQRARLQQLVSERTNNLEIANRKLEATFDALTTAAYRDSLTALHNRTYFNERLEQAIDIARRNGEQLALMYLDLDHFKMINDSYGHLLGDMLLREVGLRLTGLSIPGAEFSRLGGDEFTIIIPGITSMDQAMVIASRVREQFQKPFLLRDNEYYITTSIGVALFPLHAQDSGTLIRNADQAMYRGKDEGRNQLRLYDIALNPDAEQKIELTKSLGVALAKGEFMVHYQPQIKLSTENIVSLEALIRWNHPVRGMIPPNIFVPLAEETGLIVPIGEKVLQLVCAQIKAWRQEGLPPIRVAVNLSARQFTLTNLPERVQAIVEEHGLDPQCIELEITENMAMKKDMRPALHTLRDMGFMISIDDFGTQYSSLNYLKLLPIDKIKIDRSFVNGIARDRKDEAIIVAILLIAQRLNLSVIAEGVETSEQLAFLRENQCDEVQGFIYHRPQPAEKVTELLQKQLLR